MEIRFAECSLDRERRMLRRAGEEVRLSPKALDLLLILIERSPAVVAKSELLELLWHDTVVEEANLPNLVHEVRCGIGDEDRKMVRTVQRFGYSFDAALVRLEGGAAPGRAVAALVHAGTRVLLGPGTYRLGRDPESPLLLQAPSVSRFHARLVIDEESATIEDLDSKNGLWVGGHRVEGRVTLGDRERIVLGDQKVIWSRIASASTETAAAPSRADRRD